MEIIYNDANNSLKIYAEQSYDEKFLEFARGITYGTKGLIYKMNNVEIELQKFTLFVSLKENDELVGICVYKSKQLYYNNCTYNAFYRSFLSIHPKKMNKGYGTLIVNKTTEYIWTKFDKAIIYLYIEEENARIRRVAQKAGYNNAATFKALSHFCLITKPSKFVSKLDKGDISKMIFLLKNQYVAHSFLDIHDSFDTESYYVFKENNQIKAGLQVKVLSNSFEKFPGLYGFILMKIIPNIPRIKKIFNPTNHLFLKIGNIYMDDSKSLSILINSVLHNYKLKSCLTCLNPNSIVDSKIIPIFMKGVLSSVASNLYLFYKSNNLPSDEIGLCSDNCFFSNF